MARKAKGKKKEENPQEDDLAAASDSVDNGHPGQSEPPPPPENTMASPSGSPVFVQVSWSAYQGAAAGDDRKVSRVDFHFTPCIPSGSWSISEPEKSAIKLIEDDCCSGESVSGASPAEGSSSELGESDKAEVKCPKKDAFKEFAAREEKGSVSSMRVSRTPMPCALCSKATEERVAVLTLAVLPSAPPSLVARDVYSSHWSCVPFLACNFARDMGSFSTVTVSYGK